ncbi:MAG: hypothetical protein ACRELY_06795 [Polyangiaceae bacterium]
MNLPSKIAFGLTGLFALSATATGCTVKSDASDEYRDAIPQSGDVALAVPGSSQSSSTTSSAAGLRIAGGSGTGDLASYYLFTRDISAGVDWGTGAILVGVWAIVNQPATMISGNTATWGPGNGALDTANWRFVVTEVGDKEYDWELDGRPKASTNDADFKPVISGHGYGKSRPEHRSGTFTIDNDEYKLLEPQFGHDTGTTKVTFDLRQYPAQIQVALRPNPTTLGQNDISVIHNQDGSGEVDITGLDDISTNKDGNLENVTILSRWQSSGAGRGDVQMSGGELSETVVASQCWSSSFAQTYYTDNVSYEPTSGDPSSCAFSDSKIQ